MKWSKSKKCTYIVYGLSLTQYTSGFVVVLQLGTGFQEADLCVENNLTSQLAH